ncbi:MAG: 2-oxoacid:acceptor oxidoreductase family protein [Firmicutes bacterium]|nr:2-oxoacid:acceptor oxidoreductase family protein [Bacillota bacterium]
MLQEIIFAGFGGQGVLLMGQILSLGALEQGNEVSWLPSYGPEMRGGTANCSVVISDTPIGSPLVLKPNSAVVMNQPSMEKFEDAITPGGVMLVNSSIIPLKAHREDITTHYVPCNAIAEELGNAKVANVVMLGAYIGATGAVSFDAVMAAIRAKFAGKKAALIEINEKALRAGMDAVK